MARIYVDARNIKGEPSGVGRYASSLIPELCRQTGHEVVVIRHGSNRRPLVEGEQGWEEIFVEGEIDDLKGWLLGHRVLEAAFARGGRPDLYHSLFHVVPRKVRRAIGEAGLVTTAHDFLWIDEADASQGTYWKARGIEVFAKRAIPQALRESNRVIAISEPTRRRARAYVDDQKVEVISHGVDAAFFEAPGPLEGEFRELGRRPYVVAIGNSKEYKNLGVLVGAFERWREQGREVDLVLVGDCEGLHGRVSQVEESERITVTGYVDDQRLRSLLGNAAVFAFPSKVEGFGLPLLEAMAMGVPVICSGVEPMESIGGQAVLYFDPDEPEEVAHLVGRLVEDGSLRRRMVSRGRRRAEEFRWEKTAGATLQVYEAVLGSGSMGLRTPK